VVEMIVSHAVNASAYRRAVAAAHHANEHAGHAARAAVAGDDFRAWLHRSHARFWRTVMRGHLHDAQRERFARSVRWIAGEA
jgi:hypothetical protein